MKTNLFDEQQKIDRMIQSTETPAVEITPQLLQLREKLNKLRCELQKELDESRPHYNCKVSSLNYKIKRNFIGGITTRIYK